MISSFNPLHLPRSKNSSGVYRPKYKIKRSSRYSRSASIRVCVEVRNGYGQSQRGSGRPPKTAFEQSYLTRFTKLGLQYFFVSASVCDSRNCKCWSNIFVPVTYSGGGSNAPGPAMFVSAHLREREQQRTSETSEKCALL